MPNCDAEGGLVMSQGGSSSDQNDSQILCNGGSDKQILSAGEIENNDQIISNGENSNISKINVGEKKDTPRSDSEKSEQGTTGSCLTCFEPLLNTTRKNLVISDSAGGHLDDDVKQGHLSANENMENGSQSVNGVKTSTSNWVNASENGGDVVAVVAADRGSNASGVTSIISVSKSLSGRPADSNQISVAGEPDPISAAGVGGATLDLSRPNPSSYPVDSSSSPSGIEGFLSEPRLRSQPSQRQCPQHGLTPPGGVSLVHAVAHRAPSHTLSDTLQRSQQRLSLSQRGTPAQARRGSLSGEVSPPQQQKGGLSREVPLAHVNLQPAAFSWQHSFTLHSAHPNHSSVQGRTPSHTLANAITRSLSSRGSQRDGRTPSHTFANTIHSVASRGSQQGSPVVGYQHGSPWQQRHDAQSEHGSLSPNPTLRQVSPGRTPSHSFAEIVNGTSRNQQRRFLSQERRPSHSLAEIVHITSRNNLAVANQERNSPAAPNSPSHARQGFSAQESAQNHSQSDCQSSNSQPPASSKVELSEGLGRSRTWLALNPSRGDISDGRSRRDSLSKSASMNQRESLGVTAGDYIADMQANANEIAASKVANISLVLNPGKAHSNNGNPYSTKNDVSPHQFRNPASPQATSNRGLNNMDSLVIVNSSAKTKSVVANGPKAFEDESVAATAARSREGSPDIARNNAIEVLVRPIGLNISTSSSTLLRGLPRGSPLQQGTNQNTTPPVNQDESSSPVNQIRPFIGGSLSAIKEVNSASPDPRSASTHRKTQASSNQNFQNQLVAQLAPPSTPSPAPPAVANPNSPSTLAKKNSPSPIANVDYSQSAGPVTQSQNDQKFLEVNRQLSDGPFMNQVRSSVHHGSVNQARASRVNQAQVFTDQSQKNQAQAEGRHFEATQPFIRASFAATSQFRGVTPETGSFNRGARSVGHPSSTPLRRPTFAMGAGSTSVQAPGSVSSACRPVPASRSSQFLPAPASIVFRPTLSTGLSFSDCGARRATPLGDLTPVLGLRSGTPILGGIVARSNPPPSIVLGDRQIAGISFPDGTANNGIRSCATGGYNVLGGVYGPNMLDLDLQPLVNPMISVNAPTAGHMKANNPLTPPNAPPNVSIISPSAPSTVALSTRNGIGLLPNEQTIAAIRLGATGPLMPGIITDSIPRVSSSSSAAMLKARPVKVPGILSIETSFTNAGIPSAYSNINTRNVNSKHSDAGDANTSDFDWPKS